ncbi:DUF2929 family protein [Aquibacillus albus]|uniref:Flagellar biosynthesis protein FliQ n=1 Tax=Aquibacillus albus TaxID=1168171 RepID=A0ABS2N045_9BACI|nr:DUF2929 family protein [Aquibacillus albus]MBM7571521.1 flagellar biosynthesis protein FliQ [Aquibacillus albus]
MRYLMTIVWALLISFLVSYVLTSMAGETLTFAPIFVVAILFIIVATVIGDGILKESKE